MLDLMTQRLKLKDVLPDIVGYVKSTNNKRFPDYAAAIRSAFGEIDDEALFMRRVFTPSDLKFSDTEDAIAGTITSIQRDYYNEVVLPEGMNKDVYSGIVLYNHDYETRDIPHAWNMWIKPTSDRTALVAKTGYITDLSELGRKVYQYRQKRHPMGQSIGFYPLKWVAPNDDGYEKVYEDWKQRYLTMMLDRGIKKTKIDTSEPDAIYTKWAMMEYSDVFVAANPDAVQMAVSRGLLSSELAQDYTIVNDLDVVLRPYPGEHACLLNNRDDYDSFARKNCEQKHDGKCIDIIYGIADGVSEIQALRYPKNVWNESDARAHCKSRDGTFEAASEDSVDAGNTAIESIQRDVARLEAEIVAMKAAQELQDEPPGADDLAGAIRDAFAEVRGDNE